MSEDKPAVSCETCPMFALAGTKEASVPNRRNLGVSMCLLKNAPLDTTRQSVEAKRNAHQAIGSACSDYGRSDVAPMFFPAPTGAVMLPIIEARSQETKNADMVMSCLACVNFIPESIVSEEFGFTAGLCSARGMLISSNKTGTAAAGCEFKSSRHGQPNLDMPRVALIRERGLIFPTYADKYGVPDPVEQVLAGVALVTGNDFESDAPVSDEHRAKGIKGWRKIVSPESSSRSTMLPVFDPDFFEESQRRMIPLTGDDEHPELYVDHFGGTYATAVAWNELDETPALYGVAGVGKTELYRHLAWLMQLPFNRISITGSTEIDDLVGKMTFIENETRFQYGRLPQAWMRPGVVVLDEPNTGPPEVWQFLRPLTDNSKQLVIDQNAGEVIVRHNESFMGMAMNPAWDSKNIGAQEIGDADTNRLFHISVPLPPEQVEKHIIKDRVKLDGVDIEDRLLRSIMAAARDIRSSAEEGSLQVSWGIRPQIKVARALTWFTPQQAYRRAVSDFLDPQQQESIAEIVRANFE